MKRVCNIVLFAMSTALLCSCAVGPDYKRPSVETPEKFKELVLPDKKIWKVAKPGDNFNRGEWWKIFHDPTLSGLEDRLNCSNQSIATAYANFLQAKAIVDEARSSFFPTVTGNTSMIRQKGAGSANITTTSNGGIPSSGSSTSGIAATTSSPINTNHTLSFNASWQPDIWGLVRRTVEADKAAAQASAALFASTRLSSQASLATYYFELRGLDKDQQLLDATVKSDKEILQLTINQYRSGVASEADILSARSQLETAQALAINNRVNRALYEHAIATLIGVPASEFSLKPRPLKATPPVIPVAVPSTLLERRPDVAQAERLMAQSNAQIGVAVAAYYPSLTLTGTGSFIGHSFAKALTWSHLGWAYGPQLSQLIYDGGLRAATVKAAEEGYCSTLASYRQTVLAAFQNVEDNLASTRILSEQAVVLNKAANDAHKSLQITVNQYKAGTVAYNTVLTSQIAAYNAEKSAADINYQRMTASVNLIVALGGGWDSCKLPEV